MNTRIIEADLENPAHAEAIVTLIETYARGLDSQSAPLTTDVTARIVPGLRQHPSKLILLATANEAYAGVAVCFWMFSTFAGRAFLNVHDLAVLPDYRNQGVGTALLSEIERRARAADCCKLTLEVDTTNSDAQRLYERIGFGPWSDPALYVTKKLS